MKKRVQKMMKNEKGLTLVELLAVIVILGIIAAIAIPAIGNIINNSKVGALKSDILNAMNASELYLVDNPKATEVTFADIAGVAAGEATGEKYITEPGGLEATNFVYKDGKITATAKSDKISVVTTTATKKDIIDVPNNSKDGNDKVTISRSN